MAPGCLCIFPVSQSPLTRTQKRGWGGGSFFQALQGVQLVLFQFAERNLSLSFISTLPHHDPLYSEQHSTLHNLSRRLLSRLPENPLPEKAGPSKGDGKWQTSFRELDNYTLCTSSPVVGWLVSSKYSCPPRTSEYGLCLCKGNWLRCCIRVGPKSNYWCPYCKEEDTCRHAGKETTWQWRWSLQWHSYQPRNAKDCLPLRKKSSEAARPCWEFDLGRLPAPWDTPPPNKSILR